MQLNASEISDLIKKEIEGFDFSAEARTEGTVISVSDGIVPVSYTHLTLPTILLV